MCDLKKLEDKGQINIFHILEAENFKKAAQEKEFFIGEKILISIDKMDEESRFYFKYYHPNVVNKYGYITEIRGDQVELFVEGSYIQMRKDELF